MSSSNGTMSRSSSGCEALQRTYAFTLHLALFRFPPWTYFYNGEMGSTFRYFKWQDLIGTLRNLISVHHNLFSTSCSKHGLEGTVKYEKKGERTSVLLIFLQRYNVCSAGFIIFPQEYVYCTPTLYTIKSLLRET